MNEGIHLDLDTWIVPGQIRTVYIIHIYSLHQYSLSHYSLQRCLSARRAHCTYPSREGVTQPRTAKVLTHPLHRLLTLLRIPRDCQRVRVPVALQVAEHLEHEVRPLPVSPAR